MARREITHRAFEDERYEAGVVPPNEPDRANRRQPLGFRERVGEAYVMRLTAAVAHPCRSAA